METQHARHTRPVEVDVQESDFRSAPGERQPEVDRGHTFADPAFAAHHDQLILDAGHPGLDLSHLVGNLLDDLGVIRILQFPEN
jgi:hypothetical protein